MLLEKSRPCILVRCNRFLFVLLVVVVSACGGGGVSAPTDAVDASAAPSSALPLGVPLTVQLEGSGHVTSTPEGINCSDSGGSCDATYASGSSVTLSAEPSDGYAFEQWVGAEQDCTTANICTAQLAAARTLRAVFRRNRYSLNVTINGAGTVTSSPSGISCGSDCTQQYSVGTSVALTAAAAAGHVFVGWSGSGISCPGTAPCVVSMTAARTVSATFSAVAATTYVLQVSRVGSGTVTSVPSGINCGSDCSQSYASGTSVTLTAAPAAGYVFSGWNGGGCAGSGSCTVSMTAARTTTATFTPVTYVLNVSINGTGVVTSNPSGINCGSDCTESYASGTSVTLTAVAGSGHSFTGWSGSACSGTGSCVVSMSAARSVSATFAPLVSYALTVSVTGAGAVTSAPSGINCGSDCSQSYVSGTSVTLTAAPAEGYIFGGWGGACAGVSTCTLSMSAARAVTATFSANTAQRRYLLEWDAVNDPRVTGYRLYYSLAPLTTPASAQRIDVGNMTSHTFTPAAVGIAPGATVYFAVTAVGSGIESPFSGSVSAVVQ